MSIKAIVPALLVPGALVAIGLLFGALPAGAQAKDPVVILKPMDNSELPAGSQISEERLQETKTKIQELKAQRARQLQSQEQEASPQEALPKPEGEQQ